MTPPARSQRKGHFGGRDFADHPKDRVFDAAVANALRFPELSLLRLWNKADALITAR